VVIILILESVSVAFSVTGMELFVTFDFVFLFKETKRSLSESESSPNNPDDFTGGSVTEILSVFSVFSSVNAVCLFFVLASLDGGRLLG